MVGVGVVVPLDGPTYTHDGNVGYEDPMFAGDELYVSMTMVSTYDGRVLWHVARPLDLEADRPQDIDRAGPDLPGYASRRVAASRRRQAPAPTAAPAPR